MIIKVRLLVVITGLALTSAFIAPSSQIHRAAYAIAGKHAVETVIFPKACDDTKPSSIKLSAQSVIGNEETEEGDTNLIPSAFFLLSSVALGKLFFEIQDSDLTMTTGVWSLLLTTIAVGYDNLIIGLGTPFFGDAKTNEKTYNALKILSYPRFTAHAVLVPFLYTTGGEIGKAMGIEWLQGESVQSILVAAAAILAITSRVRFTNSPGIDIADTSDSPKSALENDLLWFTYKEVSFLYVIPAIVLALFNLVVGVSSVVGNDGGDPNTAAIWLILSAVAVLYGNSKPSHVMRFTGNLAEVVMLWCIYESALLVL